MRYLEQRFLCLDLAVKVGAERHRRVGKTLEHVDHDQRRPLAEADLDTEAALAKKFFVLFAAGHDPLLPVPGVQAVTCLPPREPFTRGPLYANNRGARRKLGGSSNGNEA